MCRKEDQQARDREHEHQFANTHEQRRDRMSHTERDHCQQKMEACLKLASQEHDVPLTPSIRRLLRHSDINHFHAHQAELDLFVCRLPIHYSPTVMDALRFPPHPTK
jgi:hypothetical protein